MFAFESEIAMDDTGDGTSPRSLPHPPSWEKLWVEGRWSRISPNSTRVYSILIPRKSSSIVPCNDVVLV